MNEAFTLLIAAVISKRKESANGCFETELQEGVGLGMRLSDGKVAGSHLDVQFSY